MQFLNSASSWRPARAGIELERSGKVAQLIGNGAGIQRFGAINRPEQCHIVIRYKGTSDSAKAVTGNAIAGNGREGLLMARKSTDKATKGNQLEVRAEQGEPDAATVARTALRPTVNAAMVTRRFSVVGSASLDVAALVAELSAQCIKSENGDLSRGEAMLLSQAHALDAIFAKLAVLSAVNMADYLDASERFMRLALKAQSQCRATIETLATIKNPPVVIARQANIAHGPQQVNNGAALVSRAREIESRPNELLEQQHGERLDPRASGDAIRSGQTMEAVGAVNGAANG